MYFRVGDKVKCVTSSLYSTHNERHIPLNVEFIVTDISNYGTIKLNYNNQLWYNAKRFILAGPKERLICLKIREMESRRRK